MISSLVTEARSEILWCTSWAREALHALLEQEAAHALVGAGPDHGDVGQRAVRDPHLVAVDDPVVAVALGVRCASSPGRNRSRARSGRSSRSARPRPCRAASAASAPRCRRRGSSTWPASPAPTPASAARSRRPRSRRTPGRTATPSRPGSRSRRGACRARRAQPNSWASSRAGSVPSSNHWRMCGRSRSLANLRTVSRSRRSSSSSSSSRSSRSRRSRASLMARRYPGWSGRDGGRDAGAVVAGARPRRW